MLDAVAPYVATASARFRMLLEYRAAALAGAATQLFWGAIKLMILGAFYQHARTQLPISLPQVVAYVWLGQAVLALLPWNLDPELQEKMTSGAIAYELLRPLPLYGFWYARTLAFRAGSLSMRMPLVLVVAGLVLPWMGLSAWSLPLPVSFASGLLFAVSLVVALALSAAITMLMHTGMILTINGRGLNTILASLVVLFSGMVVPLPLFPDWLQPLLHAQPFRGLCDVPLRIYSGNIGAQNACLEILQQLGWTASLIGLGTFVLRRATSKLVVQGG